MAKRRNLSKKLRFEVFKRDDFTCQYCGKKAPDVVLEVDHIEPVAKGGTNEITNLITACFECNRGKSDKKISDNATVKKQMNELEQLNARREQIEMVFKWKEELLKIDDNAVTKLIQIIETEYLHNGKRATEIGRNSIERAYKKYGLNIVLEAIKTSFERYEDDEKAFDMIIKVAYYIKNPAPEYVRQSYYLRGILRHRLAYVNDQKAIELLQTNLNFWEYEDIKELCLTAKNWSEFQEESEKWIEEAANNVKNGKKDS